MDLAGICTGGTKGGVSDPFRLRNVCLQPEKLFGIEMRTPKSRLQRVAPCLTTVGLVKNDEIRTKKISTHIKDERFEVGYSSIMSNVLRMSQPQESM